jgi:translation initiation factor 1
MRKNLFEMGTNFEDEWKSDNKDETKTTKNSSCKNILSPQKHQLHFAKEKRRGKVVTIVKPFCLEKRDLQTLLKSIKKKIGTGGTIKENSLEFQGELKEPLRVILEKLEYGFKR